MKHNAQTEAILTGRYGHDSLIALATVNGSSPAVRTVNALYLDGCFYTVTYALSGKMQHIAANPAVAICGEWFTASGTAENLGHILLPQNSILAEQLRTAFAAWYGNGHVNEADPNTIILQIHLTDGVLFDSGNRFDIDFT